MLPISDILRSAGLEILVPDEGALLPEEKTNIPLICKLRFPPGHLSHQAKKQITVAGAVNDRDYQGEVGLLLQNEGKRDYVWSVGDCWC